jgi:hypothetical protein
VLTPFAAVIKALLAAAAAGFCRRRHRLGICRRCQIVIWDDDDPPSPTTPSPSSSSSSIANLHDDGDDLTNYKWNPEKNFSSPCRVNDSSFFEAVGKSLFSSSLYFPLGELFKLLPLAVLYPSLHEKVFFVAAPTNDDKNGQNWPQQRPPPPPPGGAIYRSWLRMTHSSFRRPLFAHSFFLFLLLPPLGVNGVTRKTWDRGGVFRHGYQIVKDERQGRM